jgi:hypothetical protein
MAGGGSNVEVLDGRFGPKSETRYSFTNCVASTRTELRINTWCQAIYNGRINVIQKLWFWSEELHITPHELNINIFTALNKKGNNAIYQPARTGSKELLDDLLGASK